MTDSPIVPDFGGPDCPPPATAQRKLADTTGWVMRHRRPLASWLSIVVGTILAIDGAVVVLSV